MIHSKKKLQLNYVTVVTPEGEVSVEFTSTAEEAHAWKQFQFDIGNKSTASIKTLSFNANDILVDGFDVQHNLEVAYLDPLTEREAERAIASLKR